MSTRPRIVPVLLIFSLTFLTPLLFAQTPAIQTYKELLHAIRETRAASQERIEVAVKSEKVREAWETGHLIQEHILLNKDRADYGAQVMKRLSKDLGISYSELKSRREFARTYSKGLPKGQLSWAHYKALLAVNDERERETIAEKAEKENWTRDQLWEEIRKRNANENLPAPGSMQNALPEIKPGPLYTYQIVRLRDRLKIDLGFGIYRDLPEKDAKKFKEGDTVQLSAVRHQLSAFADSGKPVAESSLYTYSALVTQVVDGDTFHALTDLGFGTTMAQRVRLRRIDAPEIVSAEGKQAKALLEKILKRNQGKIIFQSHELDQHGRPIADVWVHGKPVDQEILNKGLAVKMEE